MISNPLILKLSRGANLSEEDVRILEDAVREVQWFDAHTDLIVEGDRPEMVHVIMSGFACRYKFVPDGGRQIMAYLVPGDFCDLNVAILGEMDHNIGTLTRCRVARLPRRLIDELTATRPVITRALWWATLVDEAVLREWLVGMGRRPADKQLAHLVCELYCRLGVVELTSNGAFDFPVTQADLGDTLGISEVHVNRMLHQLREAGLFERAGKFVTIADIGRLDRFAGFDPGYLHLSKRST